MMVVGSINENAMDLYVSLSAPNAGFDMYWLPVALHIEMPTKTNNTVWEIVHIQRAFGKSLLLVVSDRHQLGTERQVSPGVLHFGYKARHCNLANDGIAYV